MNPLIVNIWNKQDKVKLTIELEQEILKLAQEYFEKSNGEFKLGTFISWHARQILMRESK